MEYQNKRKRAQPQLETKSRRPKLETKSFKDQLKPETALEENRKPLKDLTVNQKLAESNSTIPKKNPKSEIERIKAFPTARKPIRLTKSDLTSIKVLSGNCASYAKPFGTHRLEKKLKRLKVPSPGKFDAVRSLNSVGEGTSRFSNLYKHEKEFLLDVATNSTQKKILEDSKSKNLEHPVTQLKKTIDTSTQYSPIPLELKQFDYVDDTGSNSKVSSVCRNVDGGLKISPIKPNVFTANCTLILSGGEMKEVPMKTTLMHRMQTRKPERFHESSPFTLDIFVSDYIEDIISYLLTINNKFLLKRNFLKAYNPCVESRSKILNWLLKMQKQLYFSTEMFFLITRLFDNVLANATIPRNMYQLVALTICWIVTKCYSTRNLSASKLLKLCANAYTTTQLLKMEIKILKVFKCTLIINDPGIFSTYYMNKLNIGSEHQIRFCVSYILESFALSHHFSTFPSSELAAGALYLALGWLYPTEGIYERICGILGYHHPDEIRDISELMYIQMQKISEPAFEAETFKKYNLVEMKKVSSLLQTCVRKPISY